MHRHYIKAVHDCLDRLDRVDLGDDYAGTECLGTHSHALAAPAVACDNCDLAGNDQVRRAVDAVPDRLTRAIAVVKQMLAVGVVDHDHRELQLVLLCHCHQTDNTGRRLLAAADHILQAVAHGGVQHIYEITAVIDDDVAVIFQYLCNVPVVFLVCGIVPCKDIQPCLDERRSHIILCGERIASCDKHLRAAGSQHLAQISGFSL